MAKDLIIGGASNYTYDHVKYWINSIKKSGFTGDIVIVATNMRNEELAKVAEQGINILVYGQKDENGNFVSKGSTAPHVERFFYLWNFLSQCEPYRFVVTTDVRDVVFQSDPIKFIENMRLDLDKEVLLAAGEGLRYKDEPWGNGNLELAFGPFFHSRIKEKQIYNVGVIGGSHKEVRDMMLMIYQMGINRPYEVVDQAVYNFLLNVETFSRNVSFMDNDSGWAINLGTTIGAVEAGEGDLGYNAVRNPAIMEKYKRDYMSQHPIIKDGVVISPVTNEPYAIVHQYDRVRGLDIVMREKYGK